MNLLLDTHIFLWCIALPEKLSDQTRNIIENSLTTIWVSSVSAWEIEIKRSLGKLEAPLDLFNQSDVFNFKKLLLNFEDSKILRDLPPLHRDPFDRMLIAQALNQNLTIVTNDPKIKAYDVPFLDA